MRGLAALVVVAAHMPINPAWKPPLDYLAVDLFFLIGGFVFAEAYAVRLDAGLSFASFIGRRLSRTWPIYALGMVLGAASIIHGVLRHRLPVSDLVMPLAGLLLIPYPSRVGALFPLNQPAWSLMFQLLANAGAALAWRRLTTPVLAAVMLAAAIGLTAAAAIYGTLNLGFQAATAWVGACRIAFGTSAGIVLWRVRRPVGGAGAWAPMLAIVALLLFRPPHGTERFIAPLAIVVLLPAVVFGAAMTTAGDFSRALFTAAGGVSYALYVIHLPILARLDPAGRPVPAWTAAGLVALLLAAAWAVTEADRRARTLWPLRRPRRNPRSDCWRCRDAPARWRYWPSAGESRRCEHRPPG